MLSQHSAALSPLEVGVQEKVVYKPRRWTSKLSPPSKPQIWLFRCRTADKFSI